MASPYRPEAASGMTGSSVAHGFAGGVHDLQNPQIGGHFETPKAHGTVTQMSHPFTPTHSYANGAQGVHKVHSPRGL